MKEKTRIRFYTKFNNKQSKLLVVVKEYIKNDEVTYAKILFSI